MTRVLNSTVGAERSEYIWMYRLEYSGGSVYLNSGSRDVSFEGNNYVAAKGILQHDSISETGDRRAQQVTLRLYGVEQSILSTILSNNFRGRRAWIYLAHYNPDTGVLGTPDLLFVARQNGDYKVTEERNAEGELTGTVSVETQLVSALGSLEHTNSVRANPISHQEMLRRAGVTPTNDTFFERVPSLVEAQITWGIFVANPGRPGTPDDSLGHRYRRPYSETL